MSHEKVTRLRQLMSEATKAGPPPNRTATEPWRHAQQLQIIPAYALFAVDISWRGITIRNITRIATWYGWTAEIQRALDEKAAASLAALNDAELCVLNDRMNQLEDCAQHGFGPPDAPPSQ